MTATEVHAVDAPVCCTCVDTEWLALSGELPEQIAARLHLTLPTLKKHLWRHGQLALLGRHA